MNLQAENSQFIYFEFICVSKLIECNRGEKYRKLPASSVKIINNYQQLDFLKIACMSSASSTEILHSSRSSLTAELSVSPASKAHFLDFATNISFNEVWAFLDLWLNRSSSVVVQTGTSIQAGKSGGATSQPASQQECKAGAAPAFSRGGRLQVHTMQWSKKPQTKLLTTGRSCPPAPGSDRAPSRTSGVSGTGSSCRTGRVVGVCLNVSAGYKLSLMKGKETGGNQPGPADTPSSATHLTMRNQNFNTQSSLTPHKTIKDFLKQAQNSALNGLHEWEIVY